MYLFLSDCLQAALKCGMRKQKKTLAISISIYLLLQIIFLIMCNCTHLSKIGFVVFIVPSIKKTPRVPGEKKNAPEKRSEFDLETRVYFVKFLTQMETECVRFQ